MAPSSPPTTFAGLVGLFINLLNMLIPIFFTIAFLFVIWKIIDAWIINAGDERKVAEGKTYVVVGVFVFALMLSAWGLVRLLRSTVLGLQ